MKARVGDVKIKLSDGSVLEDCYAQSDGDFYWDTTAWFIGDHLVTHWAPTEETPSDEQ